MKIALESKLRKQALYAKPEELISQTKTLEAMKNDLKLIDRFPENMEASEALLLFLDEKLLNKKKLNTTAEDATIFERNSSLSRIITSEHKEHSVTSNLKQKKTENSKHLSKQATISLPVVNNNERGVGAFITEPYDFSKENQTLSKILNKSKISSSKYRLLDNKVVDSLQSSILRRNYNSISILPKLKESISTQNKSALGALEQQVKAFRQQNDQLNSKKYVNKGLFHLKICF